LILYLDTSSLVKLYVEEVGSTAIKNLRGLARGIATSLVTYAETRSALARAHAGLRLDDDAYRLGLEAFRGEWQSVLVRDVTRPIVLFAGDLAEKHLLRGFDAIHLASALTLQVEFDEPVTFSAADDRLTSAAAAEGLPIR